MKACIVRQGDVLIEKISQIPKGLKKQKPVDGRVILAYGEATGHHHSIDADAVDWWKGDDKGDEQFVVLKVDSRVVHQEHSAIDLPKGNYRVTIQREYSPEEIRRVQD